MNSILEALDVSLGDRWLDVLVAAVVVVAVALVVLTAVDRAASDALARIVLAGFEERLPNFYMVGPEAVVMTRKPRSKRSIPVQAIRPIFLFESNWADSGPGFSWPEGYHLGWLPGFDRWVVTASRDTWEVDGYCDRVVDHFETCDDPVAEASRRIVKYWRDLHQNCEQERWAYLFDTGRISEAEAEDLADEVWKQEEDLEPQRQA